LRIASGIRSAGERAGHSQVSIWRDWRQTDDSRLESLRNATSPGGDPITIPAGRNKRSTASPFPVSKEKIGLILPTSLCSGQIAVEIADEMNARLSNGSRGLSRFVALPHTEGCGVSSGENEDHYLRTVVGHLVHPMVGAALLLEHGCERTHNDLMRHTLGKYGVDPQRFGYASIQLDGGIDAVMARVIGWFDSRPETVGDTPDAGADAIPGRHAFSLGLTADGPVPEGSARALAELAIGIVESGGSVIVPQCASLVGNTDFLRELGRDAPLAASLAYGEVAAKPGFHVMATPTSHFVEALTGLGATGVQVILAHVAGSVMQGHPMIPTLQVASARSGNTAFAGDLDVVADTGIADVGRIHDQFVHRIRATLTGDYAPNAWSRGHTDFQLTRGYLGVSL
jgi:hypothetical protein